MMTLEAIRRVIAPSWRAIICIIAVASWPAAASDRCSKLPEDPASTTRASLRDLGLRIGIFEAGQWNAITDVSGVLVGHTTIVQGTTIRTGVTAILPHSGNLFQNRVPAGIAVGNGFGKIMGTTQVEELGELESPIVLTNTLSVAEVAAGVIAWTLAMSGNEEVRSVNAVVAETNDGILNDIRARIIKPIDAIAAIQAAHSGPVEEGSVGAGTGTVAFGWKGGIGTSSRRLSSDLGHYTVGVLVQANYDGLLTIAGNPVGLALHQYLFRESIHDHSLDGSAVVILATDAPLSDRNLSRLAKRAFIGIGRTGSPLANGSGDYAIAFSTHPGVRRVYANSARVTSVDDLSNSGMSALFEAAIEATEEAAVNSLLKATDVKSGRAHVQPIDLAKLCRSLR